MKTSRGRDTAIETSARADATPTPSQARDPAAGLNLLIVSPERMATHSLPGSGVVLVGRAPECDVVIDDASISRRHAQLQLGPEIRLEDLGSANGTICGETRLEPGHPIQVRLGEPMQLGSVTLILQRRLPQARPRRIWDHGYFEGHIEEECGRADRSKQGFAVLFVRAETTADGRIIEDHLATWFRTADVVGAYGPAEYEVLLVDLTPADASAVVKKLATALADKGITVGMGLACYPQDNRDPHVLLALAASRARGLVEREDEMPVVVRDPMMRELFRLAEMVAKSEISVVLLGETGSGKEVLADAIHQHSPRRKQPLLRLNCAALTETLLESELFGHERGAFTGATNAKTGLLEAAAGGTVFLDELGEMPLTTQAKLLRVIEDRKVLPVGAVKERPIDVRFISATNRDLESEVVRGTFRRDLFFRLNGFSLVIPPLRDRPLDVDALAHVFVERYAKREGYARVPLLSRDCLATLGAYRWPGNVRELRNAIERAVVLCQGGDIESAHLPVEKMRQAIPVRDAAMSRDPRPMPTLYTSGAERNAAGEMSDLDADTVARPTAPIPTVRFDETALVDLAPAELRELASVSERKRILDALAQCAGNQTRAAAMLGIARRTLVKKLGQYGIARPRK
jgi:two-component system, NtrC family, response regulator AtoC